MQLDKEDILAENTSLITPEHKVIYLGPKGMGKGGDINIFVEMTETAAGITSCNWKFYLSDDEEGTVNKTEILATPEFQTATLNKGFMFMTTIPNTNQGYLSLEIDKTGTATAGKYWAGLTGGQQYGYHNQ